MAINHLAAHALSPRFASEIAFPYFLLLVSGGHCQLVAVLSPTHFRVYGETLDDAAGEVFDKVARSLGFPWPAGPPSCPSRRIFCGSRRRTEASPCRNGKAKILWLATGILKADARLGGKPAVSVFVSGLKNCNRAAGTKAPTDF